MDDNAATINDNSMRKSQKKQIENNLELLGKTHDAIKKALETGNGEIALNLLQQCQDSAIQIGEMIEESLGEDFATIGLLEAYCEQLYQIYEAIRQQQPLNSNKTCKKLNKELIRIENSVKNDIRVRTIVVFLPYKASMWDSLESVWKAADADPDCDAYVIPIPYFDKNPDRSLKEEHYEGDQYPKYVPITRYDEFDLEACRPDVIYIHNPYDECNHVTSVHPYFYSKNLRKFTDKLVYIPYFVLNEIEPDNQAAIDGMKHFCFTPGTLYADQVIVQSENMRQIYINEYIKAAKKMGLGGEHIDRKFLEKKFLGTGSPKIDKVLNTRKEDLEIPAEWLKIIEKPDGSWKKIIFYNTGVSTLLNHNEKMLIKLESVFETFKENKDEVALLWRPHPLIQATIESMRPQLWEAYKEIRDKFIAEGWGIYDDTPDMDRAVVLCDAYYGDGSSVVRLCREKGIPVMLQDVDIVEGMLQKHGRNDCIGVSIIDAVVDNDTLWFIAYDFNSLFSMNLLTGETKLVGLFPDEDYGIGRLYESMEIVNGKIFFAPFNAKSIAVYDVEKCEFSKIILEEEQIGCSLSKPLFGGMEVYGRFIFMLPIFSRAIVRIDTDSGELVYITAWLQDVMDLIFNEKDAYFRRQAFLSGDRVMVPFCNANAVLEFNCETMEYRIHELGTDKRGYSGIVFDGKNFWLSPRETGELVQWNDQGNTVEIVGLRQNKEEYHPYAYIGLFYWDKGITILPNVIKKYQAETETADTHITIPQGKYTFAKQNGEMLSFYREDTGILAIVNMETGEKLDVKIIVDAADINMKLLIKQGVVAEKTLDLKRLIQELKDL